MLTIYNIYSNGKLSLVLLTDDIEQFTLMYEFDPNSVVVTVMGRQAMVQELLFNFNSTEQRCYRVYSLEVS